MHTFLVANKEFNNYAIFLCHVAFKALDPGFSIKVCVMYEQNLLNCCLSTPFDCVTRFYVLCHAAKCYNMVIDVSYCAIDDKLLKEDTQ